MKCVYPRDMRRKIIKACIRRLSCAGWENHQVKFKYMKRETLSLLVRRDVVDRSPGTISIHVSNLCSRLFTWRGGCVALAHELRSAPIQGSVWHRQQHSSNDNLCPYLSDTQSSPLFLPQQFQCTLRRIMVLFWDRLQHILWELDVTVLELVIRVSAYWLILSLFEIHRLAVIVDRIEAYLAE